MAPVAVMLNLRADALTAAYSGDYQRGRPTTGINAAHCLSPTGATAVQLTQPSPTDISEMEHAALHRMAKSIAQLTLCQTEQKGKDCHDQDKQVQGASLGSFLVPEIDMIFGDGVGASLVRGPYCQLGVGFDAFLYWNSAAEEGAWVGLKPDLQGGTGFNLLRVQFWTLVQRKRVQKGVRKWTPLKSKVVPPGGSSFGPFIVANLLKRLFQG